MTTETQAYSYRRLEAAPATPVSDGTFNLGCFNTPFERVNMLDAQVGGIPLHATRWWKLREWQAFQIANQHYFVMVALYNAKRFGLVQFILHDRTTGEILRYEKQVSPFSIALPNNLWDGYAAYKSKHFTLTVHNCLREGKITIDVNIDNHFKLPALNGQFVAMHDPNQVTPNVVCLPFSSNTAMYSHKCLMPVNGQIYMNGKVIYFSAHHSGMIIDDHKGYYPSPTQYDWATAIGYDRQNNFIGFNLTHNQALNPDIYNENGLWYNHTLHTLPTVVFDRRPDDTWHITDTQQAGIVDLWFTPTVHTRFDKKILMIESRYHAPYGYFDGHIMGNNGKKIVISRLFGMGEDFYLKV
jgi:hypothetical protein